MFNFNEESYNTRKKQNLNEKTVTINEEDKCASENCLYSKFVSNGKLLSKQEELEKELEFINQKLNQTQMNCDHIRVCLGFDGSYQYRDTSISSCILCGEYDPSSLYQTVDATYYEYNEYGHGESKIQRNERLKELRKLVVYILSQNPNHSEKELVQLLNEQIQENIKIYQEQKQLIKTKNSQNIKK